MDGPRPLMPWDACLSYICMFPWQQVCVGVCRCGSSVLVSDAD